MNLIQGDCLTEMQKMSDDTFDITITSPPYNLGKSIQRETDVYSDFKDQQEDYYDFISKRIDEMIRVTKKWVFFNIQLVSGNKQDVLRLLGDYKDKIKEIIIWHKKYHNPAVNTSVLSADWEFIIVFSKKDADKRSFEGCNFTLNGEPNCWWGHSNNPVTYKDAYYVKDLAAIFPIWLPRKIMELFTKPGDKILDPFAGTFTVGVAAKMLNRDATGIEINPKYIDVANERLEKETQKTNLKEFL